MRKTGNSYNQCELVKSEKFLSDWSEGYTLPSFIISAHSFPIPERPVLYESSKSKWIDWYWRKIHILKMTISADYMTRVYVYVYVCIWLCVYMYICIQRQCLHVTRLASHVSAVLKWKILTSVVSYQSAVFLHKKEKRQFTSTLNLFHIIHI